MAEVAVNRRREPRFAVPLQVRIDDALSAAERLDNISLRGCCIDSTHSLEKNNVMLFHFFDQEESFCLPGKVRWKTASDDRLSRYGIEFFNSGSPFFLDQRETFIRILCSRMRTLGKNATVMAEAPVVENN